MRELRIGVYVTPDGDTRYTIKSGGFEIFNTDSLTEAMKFTQNVLTSPV